MMNANECPNCRKLSHELETLRREVRALREEIRCAKRQAAPFSRDKKNSEPKKPGRKRGKGNFSRRQIPSEDITETVNVPLLRCPDCGGAIEDKETHEHIQSDLPPARPTHTRFINESGFCPKCKKRFRSRHPKQTSTAGGAAGVSVGPNAKAIAADLHHRLGVPYAKVADHFLSMAGFGVTAGGLCQSGERLANKLEGVYEELVAAIRDCCAVYADETGWRIGTLSAWLWVFTSQKITVYVIAQRRGHEVVVEILGRKFKGVLVSDCFLAYDHREFAEWIKQKCFAHFLKELAKMESEKTRGAVRFPRKAAAILREALVLAKEKPELTARAFTRRFNAIGRRLDALIDAGRKFTDPDNRRFAKRLRKQREHLFTFLENDDADPTNNRAERMLRGAVIVRKTGGCNKTEAGARTHSVIASVLQTARQNGISPVDYIRKVLVSHGEPPPLLAPPPDSS